MHASPDSEIDELCAVTRERTIAGDFVNFAGLDSLEARQLARRGRTDEGVMLARRALEQADSTDLFDFRSRRRICLAEVLVHAGEADEAAAIARDAILVHEAKGDVTGAAWAAKRSARVGVALP